MKTDETGKIVASKQTFSEEELNRMLLSSETVIGFISSVSFLVMVFAASYAVTDIISRFALFIVGTAILITGVAFCIKIERDAGYYECPECGKRYKPTLKSVLWAPHIGRSRKMKCPFCGARRYHKKVLTK